MTLSDFIRGASGEIVAHAVQFARTLPALANKSIDVQVLSNHLPGVLKAIALDLEQPQSRQQSISKSEGLTGPALSETAAQTHGRMRAEVGLSIAQVVAEYRVLRSVVMRLWAEAGRLSDAAAIADLTRFNEAIDQAIAESVAYHVAEVDRWRNTLLAVIGHDLRTPLGTMQMATATLSRLIGDGPLSVHTGLLQRAGSRLTGLLDSLLEYNNAQLGTAMTLRRTSVDLGETCRAEIELLRSALPDVSITYEATGSLVGLFDGNRVREALTNLVSNAAQYRASGTAVHVAAEGQSDHVTVSVQNQGPPIPQEVLQTFFEPLRRRDTGEDHGPRRNLGIGLFIVREIARAHGGTVSAEASGGTVSFAMRLPKRTG
jgi:signal transduction histidine kinase